MPALPLPPLRVLVVDDNRDAADTTAYVLRLTGFDVRACYSGPAAIVEATLYLPGVCLLDLNMPGMDGDEVAERLRAWAVATRHPLVLVAVTARSDETSRGRTAPLFDLHLVKPVDPFGLTQVVNHLWAACESAVPVGAGRLDDDADAGR